MSITVERVSIPVGNSRMPGYLAGPTKAGRYPAVIVWMEIFGVNSHIRDVAERVAREGYVALAPNFFHRTAPDIDLGYDDRQIRQMVSTNAARAFGLEADVAAVSAT